MMFKKGEGDWTQYRGPGVVEVDLHRCWDDRHPDDRLRGRVPYYAKMAAVKHDALEALKDAYARGEKWVLFVHGCSTSRPGNTKSP